MMLRMALRERSADGASLCADDRFVQMNVQLLQGYYFSRPLTCEYAIAISSDSSILAQAEMQTEY